MIILLKLLKILLNLDENVEDRDIHNNEECIAGPVNSYVTADPNTPESSNMEHKITFIKAELQTEIFRHRRTLQFIPKYGSNQDKI